MGAAGFAGRLGRIARLSADNVAIQPAEWRTPPAAAIRHAGGTGTTERTCMRQPRNAGFESQVLPGTVCSRGHTRV